MSLNQPTINRKIIILADMGILFVAIFWGGGFVAAKFALTIVGPMTIMAYRYSGAAIIVFFVCLRNNESFKRKNNYIYGATCGLILFIGNSLSTIGLQYTTAGKQSFIAALYILMVPLMMWGFTRKKPENSILTAAVIGFIGIGFITLTEHFTIGKGDILTFGLAFMFSVQIIYTSFRVRATDAMTFTFIQLLVVGGLSSITALIIEGPVLPSEIIVASTPGILGLLYLITFNSAFAFMLQNFCMKYAPANHVAVILSSETVFGTICALTVANEVFAPKMIFGCILMFIAIGIVEVTDYRRSISME